MKFIIALAIASIATVSFAKTSKNDAMFLAVCKDTKLVKSEKLAAACSAQQVLITAKVEAAVKYPTAEVKVLFVNLPQ